MRPITHTAVVIALALGLIVPQTAAQTRERGPWWPHPIWGPNDQAGASNWITPAKILESVKLVTTGKVYELGHMYERGMPVYGDRTYSIVIPGWPSYGPVGTNALVGNDEFVCGEIGQIGTQFDGPGHVGARMTMADGSSQDVYYNGFTGEEMRGLYGLQQLGVENVKPILTRGILIDIAGYKNLPRLPNAYEVTVADVRGALEKQGMNECDLLAGDALLFRYGWSQLWSDAEKYNDRPPGIGIETARWIVARQASLFASDSWTGEVVPNPDPDLVFPIHQELLTRNGIFILEGTVLEELAGDAVHEFLFVFTPLPLKGATGSPGRPLAIR
jgi:kynurenine formamidase